VAQVKADVTVNLRSGWSWNFLSTVTGSLGGSYKVPPSTNVFVYADKTDTLSNKFWFDRGAVWGTLSAHEIGHKLGGIADLSFEAKNPNLMSLGDNPKQSDALLKSWKLPNDVLFTPDQIQAIFDKCKLLRSCPNGKCGGGGGGFGPAGGGVGGGEGGAIGILLTGCSEGGCSSYFGIVIWGLSPWFNIQRK
jgi:hypothetical protein